MAAGAKSCKICVWLDFYKIIFHKNRHRLAEDLVKSKFRLKSVCSSEL
jgi:hypothetical protein